MGRKRGVQYKPGSFYRADDRTGFVTRAGETKEEWTGMIVDRKVWEARQPQDFVRGVADDQTVPSARPDPPPAFVGPIFTQLSRAAAIGATFLYLDSTYGFTAGGTLGVMMDTGQLFNTTQSGIPAADGITIATPLPLPAAQGNQVQAYESPGP